MSAEKTERAVDASPEAIEERLASEGLDVHWWGNAPGDSYAPHHHGYHKVLFCEQGSIVFHAGGRDYELRPGDRLDIAPGTEHAATVGPEGVRCAEGHRR